MAKNLVLCLLLISSTFSFSLNMASSSWKVGELWQDFPGNTQLKFYIFNVTNSESFLANPKQVRPELQEIGPYVYKVQKKKVEASQQFDDESIRYREEKYYEFDPIATESFGLSEGDMFKIVNTQLIIYGTRFALTGSYMDMMYIPWLTETQGEKLIRKSENVQDILFNGMNSSIYVDFERYIAESSGPYPPGFEAFEDGRYSYFKNKNGSEFGELRVHSNPPEQYGQIVAMNRKHELSFWNGSNCNAFDGSTDGSIFPPSSLSASTVLSVYLSELGRSVVLLFNETLVYNGIEASRFVLDHSFLNYTQFEQSTCFCTDMKGNCLKDGALDIQSWTAGAPYAISFPHFHNSDSNYTESVNGFSTSGPFETFYIIEPKTGTVLESTKRLQLNIRVGALKDTTYFKTFPEFLFPILWTEETYKLDDINLVSLKSFLDGDAAITTTPTTTPTTSTTPASQTTPTTTATVSTTETSPIEDGSPISNNTYNNNYYYQTIIDSQYLLTRIYDYLLCSVILIIFILAIILLLFLQLIFRRKYTRKINNTFVDMTDVEEYTLDKPSGNK